MKGRTALVTGASRGIGLAIAERFEALGARVLTPSRAELDLRDGAAVAAYAAAISEPVDILVNDAGTNPTRRLTRSPTQSSTRSWPSTSSRRSVCAGRLRPAWPTRLRPDREHQLDLEPGRQTRPLRVRHQQVRRQRADALHWRWSLPRTMFS